MVKSLVDKPLPATLSTLSSSEVFIVSIALFTALFCTGFVDEAESALSTIVLFAPSAIPLSLVLSAALIKPSAVGVALSCFLPSICHFVLSNSPIGAPEIQIYVSSLYKTISPL